MRIKTGCPMTMVSGIPGRNQLLKYNQKDLSADAEKRMKIIDWYRLESKKYSKTGKKDVTLTCKVFGITRRYFYYWFKRFNPHYLPSLEKKSTKPKTFRKPSFNTEIVDKIKKIRKENPTYSKTTIYSILTDYGDHKSPVSESTIGRIISKYNMFYANNQKIQNRKDRSKSQKKASDRKRTPYFLRATGPHEIIEFDMKHIMLCGRKLYALCAIDQYTRKSYIHITSSPSSSQAKLAFIKIFDLFGKQIIVVNDNGSENMGELEKKLKEENITQYFTRPYKPKDKPFIERFIETYQKECLDFNYYPMTVEEMQKITDEWVCKYNTYRPHRSLGGLTPQKFEDKILQQKQLIA